MEHPEWFFMWVTGKPYITMICGWTKKDVIREVEKMNGVTWKKTYAMGGRVVRVKLQVCPTKRASDGLKSPAKNQSSTAEVESPAKKRKSTSRA